MTSPDPKGPILSPKSRGDFKGGALGLALAFCGAGNLACRRPFRPPLEFGHSLQDAHGAGAV